MLDDPVEVVLQQPRSTSSLPLFELFPPLRNRLEHALFNSSVNSADNAEKLLTKFSGVRISWAIPAVSWPREASLLGLHQTVLCGTQLIKERGRQLF